MRREVIKNILKEWQNVFPKFTFYSQNKLYKVIGPIIMGIELIKLPRSENYRPHFVIYTLFGNRVGNDIKSCLSGPILLREYYNKKGGQISISYEKHNNFFSDILESIKEQTPILFKENIILKDIIFLFEEYSKKPPLSAAPYSFLQASIQAVKLKISLYISEDEAQKILKQINIESWDQDHFRDCDVDITKWLYALEAIILNRDEFLKQIEINKNDKKIAKLQSSELTM